ncbi:hypothetical protein [Modestobacter sp. Leaf380]|uniref:hypothetical protein n=1 Tax=Modestobacter sp. Leaf380 TaxID=1736356 RepID=UPI0012F74125|nr:hypothetical protein [Modestobacter sp. Leaf380]
MPESVSEERAAELAAVKAAWRSGPAAEAGAAQLARTLAVPAELLVPLVRWARGQTGVALMPPVVGQANAAAAFVVVRSLRRRRGARGRGREGQPMPVWQRAALLGGLASCSVGPMAAVGWSRWVVLPQRSPLWVTWSRGR